MKRLNLFELEDFDWFPANIRNLVTDYLSFVVTRFDLYEPVIPLLIKAVSDSDSEKIIDLGSGGAGPWSKVTKYLQNRNGKRFEIILTDKFPNLNSFPNTAAVSNPDFIYLEEPVDACNIPDKLEGFITFFNFFHHLPPSDAHNIISSAVSKKRGIGVFELTARKFLNIFIILFTPIYVLLLTPFIRPFRWQRVLFTYLIPVVPLVALWDGIVSNLRTYSVEDFREMISRIPSDHYNWKMGYSGNRLGLKVFYLIGYPESSQT